MHAYVDSLQKSVGDWKYGIVVDGKQVTDVNEIDSLMNQGKYRVAKPEDSERNKTGICWDATAYIDKALYENSIDHRNYFYIDSKSGRTHTFTLFANDWLPFTISKDIRWIECSWYGHKGIHQVKSFEDVQKLLNDYYHVPWPQIFNGPVFEWYPAKYIGKTADYVMNNFYI